MNSRSGAKAGSARHRHFLSLRYLGIDTYQHHVVFMRSTPPRARHSRPVVAPRAGRVGVVDNRRLARVAKLAGAPKAPAAGVEFLAPPGCEVERGQPLFVVHGEAPGELEYAMDYVRSQHDIVSIVEPT